MHPEIIRKIELLKKYLEQLSPYMRVSTEELLKNEEKVAAMERYFLLMADEAFDVNSALAYQLGKKIPEDNKSTFYELSELGILDGKFAETIAESARIRNELTHNYERLQKSVMIEQIKKFWNLYEEYVKILGKKFIVSK